MSYTLDENGTTLTETRDDATVTVVGISGGQVRIAIDAPKDVTVNREEVHLRILKEKESATPDC